MKKLVVLLLLGFLFIFPAFAETKSAVLCSGWESASISDLMAAREELDKRIAELSSSPTAAASASAGTTVYITSTGKKYHSTSTCSNMKHPIAISLQEAIRRGLSPCTKCHKK